MTDYVVTDTNLNETIYEGIYYASDEYNTIFGQEDVEEEFVIVDMASFESELFRRSKYDLDKNKAKLYELVQASGLDNYNDTFLMIDVEDSGLCLIPYCDWMNYMQDREASPWNAYQEVKSWDTRNDAQNKADFLKSWQKMDFADLEERCFSAEDGMPGEYIGVYILKEKSFSDLGLDMNNLHDHSDEFNDCCDEDDHEETEEEKINRELKEQQERAPVIMAQMTAWESMLNSKEPEQMEEVDNEPTLDDMLQDYDEEVQARIRSILGG